MGGKGVFSSFSVLSLLWETAEWLSLFMLGVYVFMLQGSRRGGLHRSWFNESTAFTSWCNRTISLEVSGFINGKQEGKVVGKVWIRTFLLTHKFTDIHRCTKAQAFRHRFLI